VVSALGGLVLWIALRYQAAGPLLGLAYAILLMPAVVERWRAPLTGFMPGFLVTIVIHHWAMSKFGWFVPFLLPPILMYIYGLQALMAGALRRWSRLPALVIIPLAIGAEESLRPILALGQFNMYQVGTFLWDWPILIQAAELVGSPGLSVLWSIPFAWLVDLARTRIDGPTSSSGPWLRRGAILSATSLVFIIGYGGIRLATLPAFEEGPRVAIIQPSEDHGPDLTHDVVMIQRRMTLDHVAPGEADLIAWPENAILARYDRFPDYQATMKSLARSRNAAIVFGTMDHAPGDPDRPSNASVLISPEGEELGRYHKMVLFPFTERRVLVGVRELIPPLGRLIDAIVASAWHSGAPDGWSPDHVELLTMSWDSETGDDALSFWTPVCYEAAYTHLAREAALGGARFFVNLTSEGWLGWAVSNNQMGSNVLRAVEHRVGLVRVGNTGPSGFIAPSGEIEEYLVTFELQRRRLDAGVLTRAVQIGSGEPTLYGRIGGVLDMLWPLAWLALFVGVLAKRFRAG
jgi:apolipoprotein N-acyltransferase